MSDITKIAAACANRIMDRMEMCRGSAILKSDIEREVEMALRECSGDIEGLSHLNGGKCYVYHKDSALHVYDEDEGKAQDRIDNMSRKMVEIEPSAEFLNVPLIEKAAEEFNPLWPTVTDEGKQALADGLGSLMRRSPQVTCDASADVRTQG